jgi:ATP-binding cassette subfamily C protein LapB
LKLDSVIPAIEYSARLVGQAVPRARIDEIASLLQQLSGQISAAEIIQRIWKAAALHGHPALISAPAASNLPFLAWRGDQGWLTVVAQNSDGTWTAQNTAGKTVRVTELGTAECISLPGKRADSAHEAPVRAANLVWRAIYDHKAIFLEATLATVLINILTLTASLYSMQVYDRVIPNKGFQTLWVLTTGIALAIMLEFFLRHVRSATIDKTCRRIDTDLSRWFFQRSLGIRLDYRPLSVGTLASQIRSFEMVRGILTSTTLFVITDIPFAVLFVFVIFLIGGWVAAVPLAVLPFALGAGFIFQRWIARATRENLSQSNNKTGLLVESIDGAESLKANAAEWKFQARWNRLIGELGESDYAIKHYSSMSQHITVALQQIGYIIMIAVGAYLVTENMLTMGGLIACSIISGRAMSPIAQLPGILVQLAHARAALEALDKVIALPNEIDEAAHTLVPQNLQFGYRFERVRFAYRTARHTSIELPQLTVHPGNRIGLLGSIGSGKSTLLKLFAGLYRPTEGKVFLGDVDISLISPAFVRESIGYLPQDVQLFSGTLRDNLLLGLPDPGDGAILDMARKTGLIGLITGQDKGLALPLSEGGRGVSGGQRQLVGLTRLLLANPRVWLLDEPTASLDAENESKVVAILQEIAASGATMIISTHKTALLPLLPRLLVIREGHVIMDGTRSDVLAKLTARPQEATN